MEESKQPAPYPGTPQIGLDDPNAKPPKAKAGLLSDEPGTPGTQAVVVPVAETVRLVEGLIGASLKQVWKPLSTIGVNSDATAPFALGTMADGTLGTVAQFCRITANVAIGGTAGITAGLSVTAATGNTWTNNTGQALVIGDYCFLTALSGTTP